jgi:hypothetical protein
MQGYSKGKFGPFIPVYYNRYVDSYKQTDCKWSLGPFILV